MLSITESKLERESKLQEQFIRENRNDLSSLRKALIQYRKSGSKDELQLLRIRQAQFDLMRKGADRNFDNGMGDGVGVATAVILQLERNLLLAELEK